MWDPTIPSKTVVLGVSRQSGSGTHPDSAPHLKSTSGGTWFLPKGTAISLADKRARPEVLAVCSHLSCCGTLGCGQK
eukprot:913040-Pelagomonas_calceolata.AAC.1